MVNEALVRALENRKGNPKERDGEFLAVEDREYLYEQATRLYEEYVEAVMASVPPGEEQPPEKALEKPGFAYMMEIVFEAGYELGQEDGEGGTVMLDHYTLSRLAQVGLEHLLANTQKG